MLSSKEKLNDFSRELYDYVTREMEEWVINQTGNEKEQVILINELVNKFLDLYKIPEKEKYYYK